jgi:hypothetical protein
MNNSEYDLDIAAETIYSFFVLKLNQFDQEIDLEKRIALQNEIDILMFEKDAIYKNGDMRKSLIHKAFSLYSPQLKAYYAS